MIRAHEKTDDANEVNLENGTRHGIAIFSSPLANSRSVAELVVAEVCLLPRQLLNHSMTFFFSFSFSGGVTGI